MQFRLADSDTGRPFKLRRAKKQSARKSLFAALCRLLGWEPSDNPERTMKKVKMLVPCIAGGKPRRKGEEVTLTDMKAAELVGMKVATVVGEVDDPKIQPWEKSRTPKILGKKTPKGAHLAPAPAQ